MQENGRDFKALQGVNAANEYAVGVEFIQHNKESFLKNISQENPVFKRSTIFQEMATYFVLPLIRDAFLWVFEFIRNLIHIGFMEYLYFFSFFVYTSTYSIYSESFHTLRYTQRMLCDIFTFSPLICAQIVHTWCNYEGFMYPLAYGSFCMMVVVGPRLSLHTMDIIRDKIPFFRSKNSDEIMYGIAAGFSLFYGITIAVLLYTDYYCPISLLVWSGKITDLYIRECFAGIISFSAIRAFFLYTEVVLDKAPYRKKNLLLSERDVFRVKSSLMLIMMYFLVLLGSGAFIYTYYSFKLAAEDTSIVEDIQCISYVTKGVMCDPLLVILDISRASLVSVWEIAKEKLVVVGDFLKKHVMRPLAGNYYLPDGTLVRTPRLNFYAGL
ncbi:uncharacterized protein NEMAJ01_2190 [Nematocida major]|uniref:uncharacterized protein n=1 Tax=Nematocida major TaxID=1912982 RepID=UPI002008926E|nr:uncharacterized protein NEMAJ01_2190 [Nematocida major]KAH9387294.1 hypothetical protein NEMAJ01_2190 [Nematocida major]